MRGNDEVFTRTHQVRNDITSFWSNFEKEEFSAFLLDDRFEWKQRFDLEHRSRSLHLFPLFFRKLKNDTIFDWIIYFGHDRVDRNQK